MNRNDFDSSVVEAITGLWPRFADDWNEANRMIAFRMLNTFTDHQVVNAIEQHRMDFPDARAPEFKAVLGKLWAVRKAGPAQQSERDLRFLALAWGRHKSEGDLAHLAQVAAGMYGQLPKLWPFIEATLRHQPRCPLSLIIAWSTERSEQLGFARGSDEWQELMLEYDIQERRRENDRVGPWSSRNLAAKAVVGAQLANVRTSDVEVIKAAIAEPVTPDGAAHGSQDEIPF